MAAIVDTATVDRINDIAEDVAYMRGAFDAHIKDGSKHTVPPCEALNTLSSRIWGLGIALLFSLGGTIYSLIKGTP